MTPWRQDGPADETLRREAVVWLARVRGNHDAGIKAAFEAWYSADARHAEAFDAVISQAEFDHLLARTPAAHEADRLAKYGRRRNRHRILLMAATLVLGIGAVAAFAVKWGPGTTSLPSRQEQVASADAELRIMKLPDGSRATLDAGSVLKVDFSESERRLVLVRGRARFDVVHDADRPFIVAAGAREVVAHGTLFDVDLRGNRLAVSLLRGSIEVRQRTAVVADQKHAPFSTGQFLQPGQRLLLDDPGEAAQLITTPADDPDWTEPMVTFEDRPLSEVIALANRHGIDQIVLSQPALASLRYSGTVRANDTQGIAQMIAASFDLAMTRDDHGAFRLARRN